MGTTTNPTGRDSHGIVATRNKKYVHTLDRIQAEAYSLRTDNVCELFAVTDDSNLPKNDPSPDLLETTPDGEYLALAFRGPAPVTFSHSTQGSCSGVGIVKLERDGRRGKLVTVLRTTNLTPDLSTKPVSVPGGVNYAGTERSDIHMVAVIDRKLW
ncbi:hypothetical protein ACHAW5_008830 [Stephanodiscus triporus]|uniref:Uncharacterized protein n=1 Tax=Stephanodiscus triporus TaxID=2934178 RepID=A0ABD3N8A4_9STRA